MAHKILDKRLFFGDSQGESPVAYSDAIPGKEGQRQSMSAHERKSNLAGVVYIIALVLAGMYFTFSSVQGDSGLFNRIQIDAEARALEIERDRLSAEIAALQNKTRRLSDDFLDLDLLDEQAREILGLVRGDEIVLR